MRRLRHRWRRLWKTATRPFARLWDRLPLDAKQILVLVPLVSLVLMIMTTWGWYESYHATRRWRDISATSTLEIIATKLKDELSSEDEVESGIQSFFAGVKLPTLNTENDESKSKSNPLLNEARPWLLADEKLLNNVLTLHVIMVAPESGLLPQQPTTSPPAHDAGTLQNDDTRGVPGIPALDVPAKAFGSYSADSSEIAEAADYLHQGRNFRIWQGRSPKGFDAIEPGSLLEIAMRALDFQVIMETDGRLLAARRVFEGAPTSDDSSLILVAELKPVQFGFFSRICATMLVTCCVSIVLVRLSRDVVVNPVKRLADRMAVVATSRDFTQRLETHRSDEIGALTTRFNEMLAEIQKVTDDLLKSNSELEARVNERTAQLRRMNLDLDVYAHAVAHDLRQPLRAISFASERLRDHSDLAVTSLGEKVFRHVHHSQQMITSILELIRGQDVPMQSLYLRVPIDNVLSMMEEDLRQTGTEVDLPTEFPHIMGNVTLLQQIFQNLITNSIKYNRQEHKRIEIRTRPAPDGRMWEVSVKDNGAGIREEMKERIFLPFKQIHREGEFPRGTGLGLAWVRRIVDLHNGEIRFESTFGEGTTFYFTLPASSPGSSAPTTT